MFQKGEYVVYGSNGICMIEDIANPGFAGVPKDKLYYILEPLGKEGSKIYSPVESRKVKMRRVMNEEEAEKFIEQIPLVETLWISSEKTREESYREAMLTEEPIEWVKIIKTLYQRGIDRMSKGKKITVTDERYLKQAEESLYSELSFALGRQKEGMADYIKHRIEQ